MEADLVREFALANAGVSLNSGVAAAALGSVAAWGSLAGLVLGKPLGIVGSGYLAEKLGIASLPEGVT